MRENPANNLSDSMWKFLADGNQQANIPALKEYVYSLIQMTIQKDAGQRKDSKGIPFETLDMLKWAIICEAVALVLSGKLDALEDENED